MTFKQAIKELSEIDNYTVESIEKWFNKCDKAYQKDEISYKDLEILLKISNKIIRGVYK